MRAIEGILLVMNIAPLFRKVDICRQKIDIDTVIVDHKAV